MIRFLCVILVFSMFFIYFYRKPAVQTIRLGNDNRVYFPAYGTIKKIEVLPTNELFVAIFLSPLDIHYQYMPVRGTVMDIRHDDIGRYCLAFDLEKSKHNEKMIYTIGTKNGVMKLYQIAGFLVHRISTNLSVGQTYETGDEVGMIKFGSRVDIIIPSADRFTVNRDVTYVGASVNPEMVLGAY
jgi:phosphatidylserine decarboxylase